MLHGGLRDCVASRHSLLLLAPRSTEAQISLHDLQSARFRDRRGEEEQRGQKKQRHAAAGHVARRI